MFLLIQGNLHCFGKISILRKCWPIISDIHKIAQDYGPFPTSPMNNKTDTLLST